MFFAEGTANADTLRLECARRAGSSEEGTGWSTWAEDDGPQAGGGRVGAGVSVPWAWWSMLRTWAFPLKDTASPWGFCVEE